MISRDPFERASNGFALVATAAAAALAIGLAAHTEIVPPPAVDEPPVVMLQAEEPPPVEPPLVPAPPPPPPMPPPPKLEPTIAPRPAPAPVPSPAPAPAPVPPPPPPAPVAPSPAPLAPSPPAPAPVPPPAPAPPPAVNNATIESSYVGRLRNYIRSITEYPTSGDARRLRPEGSSQVRFTLTRDGAMQGAEIETASGSPILDKQALAIVRGGKYPPWPADAWPASGERVFTVTVVFVSP